MGDQVIVVVAGSPKAWSLWLLWWIVAKSTNSTRNAADYGLKIARLVNWASFVGGGLVTPKLAAKAATRRWQHLPSNAGRRKDNRPEPGRIASVDVGLRGPLVVETWGDAGPLVYLVHGWGGWRGQVASFVAPLVDRGCQVMSFDCLSHGDSPPGSYGPTHSCGGEMIECFKAVVTHLGQPHGIVGHSLGCANAARAIIEGQVTAERLAMVAPSPDMRLAAHRFGHAIGFSERTTRLMVAEMEKYTERTFDDFDIAAMAVTGQLPQGLMIHDRDDKEAPYQETAATVEKWPGATLMSTDGLGHHRILIDPAVIKATVDFITS